MTYLEAAEAVLRSSRQPLTVAELTARAIRKGLLQPSGKTPESTMSAALYEHVNTAKPARIERVASEGPHRAVRGTVRWYVSEADS
jgi:hypothetical protein